MDEALETWAALSAFENFDGFSGTTLKREGPRAPRGALAGGGSPQCGQHRLSGAPDTGPSRNAFKCGRTEYNFENRRSDQQGARSHRPRPPRRSGAARTLSPRKSTNISNRFRWVKHRSVSSSRPDYFRIKRVPIGSRSRRDFFAHAPPRTQSLIAGGFAEAANLQEFVFFVNDFATVTSGIDLVSTYATELFGGETLFTAVFNFTNTELTDFESETIDEDRRSSLERGLPETRWNIGVSHAADLFTVSSRLSYYGSYWDREDARNWASVTLGDADLSPMYELYAGKALLDLEVGVPLDMGLTLSVGAQNLLNTYPDKHPLAAGGTGNDYGQFGPFGFKRLLLLCAHELQLGLELAPASPRGGRKPRWPRGAVRGGGGPEVVTHLRPPPRGGSGRCRFSAGRRSPHPNPARASGPSRPAAK